MWNNGCNETINRKAISHMFAIELTEDNLARIIQEMELTPTDILELKIYAESNATWYFIRGYVSYRGEIRPWTCMPRYILNRSYDYDPLKAKTDWDLIVRN